MLSLCKYKSEDAPTSEDDIGGKLTLDVLVYDLETAALLGAYDLLVTNDPELELPGAEQSESDWLGLALSDLKVNAEHKIEEKLGIAL